MIPSSSLLRGIPGLLSAAHPHQHVGDGHRTFPIDGDGEKFAVHVDRPEAGRSGIRADFYHDSHPLPFGRALSCIPVSWYLFVASWFRWWGHLRRSGCPGCRRWPENLRNGCEWLDGAVRAQGEEKQVARPHAPATRASRRRVR